MDNLWVYIGTALVGVFSLSFGLIYLCLCRFTKDTCADF